MKKTGTDTARSELDDKTIALIDGIAEQVRADIEVGRLPNIKLPVRSLDNVTYDRTKGYFELGSAEKVRTLTVTTARAFAQTLRLMATSRTLGEHNDFATKREVFTSARTGESAASTNRLNRTQQWTTSRPWRRCTGCRESSCA